MKVTDLITLGKKSIALFDEYLTNMNIEPPTRVYVRHFLTELEVSESACKSQGSTEIIQKPEWTKIVYDFVEQKVKPLQEFEKLNQSIAKKYKKNINTIAKGSNELNQVAYWLQTFVRRLVYEKLEGKISEDSVIEYASLFKSELELSPHEFRYVHHLDGIFIDDASIQINDNVAIRKTQMSDLEYTRDIFLDLPGSPYMGLPSSILEINISERNERDCHKYMNRLFNSLRLYKLGSIYSMKTISTKKTIIWPAGQQLSFGRTNYSAHRKYTVTKEELDVFVQFIRTIEPRMDFSSNEKEHRSLSVSMERYNSALLESTPIDRRLMSAVMGLESLLTFEKDRGENAFKLAIRVARLLGNLGLDALKVRSLTGESYGFRNRVVHGSNLSQKDIKRMGEILPDILNYLRVSLTIFLLSKDMGKDRIIDMIDKSTISDVHNEKLNNAIESHRGWFAEKKEES